MIPILTCEMVGIKCEVNGIRERRGWRDGADRFDVDEQKSVTSGKRVVLDARKSLWRHLRDSIYAWLATSVPLSPTYNDGLQ